MFRKYLLILFGALLLSQPAQSQLADKATFFGGFGYHIVSTRVPNEPRAFPNFFYGLALGMDYVLLHSNDQVSLGVNPNLNFCFSFGTFSGVSLLAQTPVFLLARVGAGATPYNEQKVGIGAGIGVNSSYLLHDDFNFDRKYRQLFFNPSAVAELTIRTRASDYIFRFNWSLFKPVHEVEPLSGVGPDQELHFGVAGLSIVYSF